MKPLVFAGIVLSLIVCSSVSASDSEERSGDSEGIVYGAGYVRIHGVRYIPETRAMELADRQTKALEAIAARLKDLAPTIAVEEE